MSVYLYGIVPSRSPAPEVRGIEDEEVWLAARSELAILCSGFDGEQIEPRRIHLIAHDRVLTAAMRAGPIVPLRFGSLVPDGEDPTRVVLARLDEEALAGLLLALNGQVEVVLSYEPHESGAVSRVVRRFPEVQDRRRPAIERGRRIVEEIQALAAEDLTCIADRLAAQTTMLGEVEERRGRVRVAMLVPAAALDGFLDQVEHLAREVEPTGELRAVGGLPPYSFSALPGASIEV